MHKEFAASRAIHRRLVLIIFLVGVLFIPYSKLAGQSTLYFPFYQADAGTFVGFAISNYSTQTANLQFAIYEPDGDSLPLRMNPVSFSLQGQTQLAKLGNEIFGIGASVARSGWVELSTDNAQIGGFFQFGNSALTRLDGSAAITEQAKTLYFTRIFDGPTAFRGQSATTFISLANPNPGPITLQLTYHPSQIQVIRQLPAKGYLYEAASQIFGQDVSGGYIKAEVTEGNGAVGFELVQLTNHDSVIGLNASQGNDQNQSFSAQLASGSSIYTSVKLVNTSTETRQLTVSAIGEDGENLVSPVPVTLGPGEFREQDAGALFGFESAVVGSMSVTAQGDGVIGDVIFGDPDGFTYAAGLPLQTEGLKEAVFSHVANSTAFFTGLAFFNPAVQAAEIRIEVFSPDGLQIGETTVILESGRRLSKVISELVPSAAAQIGGFVKITSTQPVIAQQLFGSSDLSLLSAVPPTTVVDGDTQPPQFNGVGPGTFWEYHVLEESTRFAQGSDTTRTFDLGRFRITLGDPLTISGIPMYEVEVSGLPGSLPLAWERLGADASGRFYGSGNFGGPLQTLYDPTGSAWAGGGLFTEFPDGNLVVAQSSTFKGIFFDGPADVVQQSFDQNNCELILGMLICGGEPDISVSRREYWSSSLGPVGLLFSSSFSSCGGGFCSGSSSDLDVGLVRSSINGDSALFALETEPSQLSTPMPIPLEFQGFMGFAHPRDEPDALNGIGGSELVHDTYSFTLASAQVVAFLANWSESHEADLDFFIVDDPPTTLFVTSNQDNVGLNDYSEYLEVQLSAGDYLLVVQHFSIPLRSSLAPPPVEYIVEHTLR